MFLSLHTDFNLHTFWLEYLFFLQRILNLVLALFYFNFILVLPFRVLCVCQIQKIESGNCSERVSLLFSQHYIWTELSLGAFVQCILDGPTVGVTAFGFTAVFRIIPKVSVFSVSHWKSNQFYIPQEKCFTVVKYHYIWVVFSTFNISPKNVVAHSETILWMLCLVNVEYPCKIVTSMSVKLLNHLSSLCV